MTEKVVVGTDWPHLSCRRRVHCGARGGEVPAEAAEANVKWYSMRFQWCQIGRTAFYRSR